MQDEAWKEIIEKLFPDFLAFFDIFEIKFGKNIYEFFTQLKQIQDIEILQQIRLGLKKAQTLEETKNLILLQLSNWQKT